MIMDKISSEQRIKIIFYSGLSLLFISIFWALITSGGWIGWVILSAALLMIGFVSVKNQDVLKKFFLGQDWKSLGIKSYYIIILLAIVVLVNVISTKRFFRADITASKRYTLSDHTITLLKQLKEAKKEIKIIFFRSEAGILENVNDLLKEYKTRCPVINVEFVDPDKEPQRAKQYDIRGLVDPYGGNYRMYGTIVMLSAGLKETIDVLKIDYQMMGKGARPNLNVKDNLEREISSALLRLTKAKKKIYFIYGHGEVDLDSEDNSGWSTVKKIIVDENYIVDKIYLATAGQIPNDCDLLVLGAPENNLLPQEIDLLNQYLEQGGHMLVLNDTLLKNNLNLLLNKWGIRVSDKMIIDRGRPYWYQANVPLVSEYNQHPVTEKLKYQTFFPAVSPVELMDKLPAGVSVQPLAKTSPDSWVEMDPNSKKIEFNQGVDKKGPVNIIAAVSKKIPEDKKEMRMIIIGDADFVCDGVIKNAGRSAGNADLLLNIINWLAGKEELIGIRSKPVDRREIELSPVKLKFVFYSCVVILPLLIIIAGVLVWLRRR